MLGENLTDAIKLIRKRLDDSRIKWALVGSANLKLQGMETEPHDLDVVIQHKDLEKVRRLFHNYSASEVAEMKNTLSGKPAWEVKARINGIEIQFFGGDENDIYTNKLLANKTININLDGAEIPCFALEAEAQAYAETGREHKARLIQQYLDACRTENRKNA